MIWTPRKSAFNAHPESTREMIHAAMKDWLDNPDLASIRDTEKLKAIPPDEQSQLEKLWRDTRDLRDRTGPRPLLPRPN